MRGDEVISQGWTGRDPLSDRILSASSSRWRRRNARSAEAISGVLDKGAVAKTTRHRSAAVREMNRDVVSWAFGSLDKAEVLQPEASTSTRIPRTTWCSRSAPRAPARPTLAVTSRSPRAQDARRTSTASSGAAGGSRRARASGSLPRGFLRGSSISGDLMPARHALRDGGTGAEQRSTKETGAVESLLSRTCAAGRSTTRFSYSTRRKHDQNAGSKMFLTRLGNRAKAIVNGDVTQIDLDPPSRSGSRRGAEDPLGDRRVSSSSI